MESPPRPGVSNETTIGSRKKRRCRFSISDDIWESHREDICEIYLKKKNTLKTTMEVMEATHKFQASERKFKKKLKEWKVYKYVPAPAMKVILAKASGRTTREGKETVFYSSGQEISAERIENFKKRKNLNGNTMPSPSAATPPNITYHSPRMDYNVAETENESSFPGLTPISAKSILETSPGDPHIMQIVDELTSQDDHRLSIDLEDSAVDYTTSEDCFSVSGAIAYASSGSDEESYAEANATAFEVEGVTPAFTPRQTFDLNASLNLDIHLMKNDQYGYEDSYRRVAAGCKKLDGGCFLSILQIISALSVLHDEQQGYKQAEFRCRKTIVRFKNLGSVEDRLDFQRHLVVLLDRTGLAKDSVDVIYPTSTECDKPGLKRQEAAAIRSSLDWYLRFNRFGYVESVKQEMKKILTTAPQTELCLEADVSTEKASIDEAGSRLEEFFWTHKTFSYVLPKLEKLRNSSQILQEKGGYNGFCIFNRRQDIRVDAAEYLMFVLRGLIELGRRDDKVTCSIRATLIDVLLAEFDELSRKEGVSGQSLPELIMERLTSMCSVGSEQDKSPMGGKEKADKGDNAESIGRSKDGEDDAMTDATSCKYGLTYSASAITGVSDSVYMVP